MRELNELNYPAIRDAMKSLEAMPDTDECIQAAAGITARTALMPGADILEGTPRDRAHWLEGAIENYHVNLDHLQRALHDNVAAIKTYAAEPTTENLQKMEAHRVGVEIQLNDVQQDCQDVSVQLARFKQIQGMGSQDFSRRLTEAVGVIGPLLDQEARRLVDHPLDVNQFDRQWKAEGRAAAHETLVARALNSGGRHRNPASMVMRQPQRSSLRNEVAQPPDSPPSPPSDRQPSPQLAEKVTRRRSR
jgi:hypothetical protein